MWVETIYSINDKLEIDAKTKEANPSLILAFAYQKNEIFISHLNEIKSYFPNAIISGISSDNFIKDDKIYENNICFNLIGFEKTKLKSVNKMVSLENDEKKCAQEICEELKGEDLCGILLFCDGLLVNSSIIINEFNNSLINVPIFGALASDGTRFEKTFIINNGEILDSSICAIGFYSEDLIIKQDYSSGWYEFGPEWQITKSKGDVVYEIDNLPALELYDEYLETNKNIPANSLLYPLLVWENNDKKQASVRAVLSINREDNSLTFGADVNEGSKAKLCHSNYEMLIKETIKTSKNLSPKKKDKKSGLLFAIVCIARREVLQDYAIDEITAIRNNSSNQMPLIGFYSYGEISTDKIGHTYFHNQSLTLIKFTEN